jgi:hypothetical protein
MRVPDFLDEKRSEIDDRLAELQPLVEEYSRLQAASAALAEVAGAVGMHAPRGIPSPAQTPAQSAEADVSSPAAEAPTVPSPPIGLAVGAPVRRGPGRPRGSGGGGVGIGSGGVGAGSIADGAGGESDGVSNGDAPIAGEDVAAEGATATAPTELRPSTPGPRRAGRPKGSGQRAAEALRIVREQPGVTIPELADRMGIKQNYLYRVLPELVQEGKVVKQGRGWHPRAA